MKKLAIILSTICLCNAFSMNIPDAMSGLVSQQALPDLSKFELLCPKTVQTFEDMAYYDVDLENEAWDLFYSCNYHDAYEKFKRALCVYQDNKEWEIYLTHLVDSSLDDFCSKERFNDKYIFGLECLKKSFSRSNLFPPIIRCCQHLRDSLDNVDNLDEQIYFLKKAFFWSAVAEYDEETSIIVISATNLKKRWK